MPTAWLSLGANIGEDPASQVRRAVALLDAADGLEVTGESALMTTKPWGKTDQPDFINMALEVNTTLPPTALLELCFSIERRMGRERLEKWGPRVIDIDIIAYDRQEILSDRLKLPHPHAHERSFVLDPLREIAPDTANWLEERARSRS
ncbi:2-amino-4-hydroxy-6-hydroxymethyldihydropteridine diphosphokinase [Devosia pacifica]|uniref:2-amino-4-hydroxy-6-hydroxymethyldihydropteridine pyrophosphokinase n=1 Tax=Devosia pacifica TaxID=1335967 RepID=A0A918RUN1_9HYPH|nr:2-amino-4-hydroxy-6-hydroxymethyldihydropteridine diphosphokinase [Devosia pacifica]GHA12696.1 2-amino-4-hydroxy-6-hydroxymethyldihydropteridine diphosphokinase [Devosia pacifica]